MKKSLIALAVAGAFAAPAFAATSNVDVYGIVSYSVDYMNTGETAAGADKSDMNAGINNVSRLGFKGSEDLGGGLKALWQIESGLSTIGSRNTFVGLNGGFGTVLMGQHDAPYKLATGKLDPFADTIGDYNGIMGRSSSFGDTVTFDLRAPQTIAYISPTVSGFHAAVAYVSIKANEGAGNDETTGWSALGMYDNGPLFASLAYETHEGGLNVALGTAGANTSSNAWKLGLGYSFGDTKLGFVYEDQSVDGVSVLEHKAWYVSASHAMGPIVLKASYGKADDGEGVGTNNDADMWALGADYNLSKRTSVYAVYANLDNDGTGSYDIKGGYNAGQGGANVKGFSLGVKHSF